MSYLQYNPVYKNISPGLGIQFFLSRNKAFGNLNVINFSFASLNSKQIVSLQIILQLKIGIVR